MAGTLHERSVAIDGLQICNWSREIFEEQHAAGLTAVNCTCSVWEGFDETMENVGVFRARIAEHADILRPVHALADVAAAKEEGRVGIILGFQNTWPLEDRLDRLELFHGLGVRIIQMTYNTQNLVGAGCWESHDGGLSDYGRDVLAEMNRLGIVADLSHVGSQTAADVVTASTQPVVYSHVCPHALNPHPRNKTDEQIRAIVERGGLVGITLLPWFLRADGEATRDDYLRAIEHVIDVAGEEHVGIGTDFMQGYGIEFLTWLRRDKGVGRLLAPMPDPDKPLVDAPTGLERVATLPALTEAMEQRGWSEQRIERVLGLNWLRLLGDVWRD
jgi:membrane dipeptidase